MNMYACKSHMYTCKSHGNVYMQISWKCIHSNLIEMDNTCKSHANRHMEISWKGKHGNLMKIYTCECHEYVLWKSHGNGYMQIS